MVRDDQIYRIDHYLGKETVQNIMVFRFANGIFEPIWNRRYIDHVQITVAESVGVERRGPILRPHRRVARYDAQPPGAVLALTAMEPPSSFSAAALQNEQVKVLESVPPINPEECAACVIRGQYTEGTVGESVVAGYREEPFVDANSQTETYVALKIAVDNWRWAGVPFYLGRANACARGILTSWFSSAMLRWRCSGVAELRPQGRIHWCWTFSRRETHLPRIRRQGSGSDHRNQHRRNANSTTAITSASENRTGYETLLYDAMIGDSSLFKRADMIEAGWAAIQPILQRLGGGARR